MIMTRAFLVYNVMEIILVAEVPGEFVIAKKILLMFAKEEQIENSWHVALLFNKFLLCPRSRLPQRSSLAK
jgi:hypothetical protein